MEIAATTLRIGHVLAQRAERLDRTRTITQVAMTVIGLAALISANVPAVSGLLGSSGDKIIAVIAAASLLLASAVTFVIGRNPPERFKDYSRYVLGYDSRISELLADDALPKTVLNARLTEVIRLANKNIEDVRSRWAWVEAEIKTTQNKRMESNG